MVKSTVPFFIHGINRLNVTIVGMPVTTLRVKTVILFVVCLGIINDITGMSGQEPCAHSQPQRGSETRPNCQTLSEEDNDDQL